jgi:acyl dehydratase
MRYYEDLSPGQTFELGAVTLTADEVIEFGSRYDPQPFHTDPKAAAGSPFGGLIASGWHTCALAMRLFVDHFLKDTASLGSPGVDELRWVRPVRPGDSLSLSFTVVKARTSDRRPELGIVQSDWTMVNQRGEIVLTMRGTSFLGRKP